MKAPSAPAKPLDVPTDRTSARLFFGTGAVVSVLTAVLYSLAPMAASSQRRSVAVGACALLALIFVGAGLLTKRFRMARAVAGAGWASVLLVFVVTVSIGEGLQTPNLGFVGVVVCVVTVLANARTGYGLAGASAAALVAMAWAERAHLMPGFELRADTQVELHLLMQLTVLSVALIAGVLMSRIVRRSLDEVTLREQRLAGLLRMAVDHYWETDSNFRFTQVSDPRETKRADWTEAFVGRTPWEVDDLGLSDDQLDAHRADLESHRPFSGVITQRKDARGQVRYVSNSGEPKFDAEGVFLGYWAVGREVTAELRARQSLTASEVRYRDLFERSPSPLLLHRRGLVIEANDAAARLFGFEDPAQIVGYDMFELFPEGEPRARAVDRVQQLEQLPVGVGLPVSEYQLQSNDGRVLSVQATAVQIETANGAAVLSIFFDITGRKAAEAALRRSEAMLSHLFATTPDLISLTEMATGRYTMVNQSFSRVTGFSAAEVMGRTSSDIGIWHCAADRERLVGELREHRVVNDFRAVFVAKGGALVSLLISAARFTMSERDYLVINGRDVTETERARIEHEAILQRASIGIAFTRGRKFVRANPRFERMFGWDAGALIGQPISVVWPSDDDYAEVGRHAGAHLSAGQPVDMERLMRRQDGSDFWCRLMAEVVVHTDAGTGGTIWIAEDVTERRQTDQALAAARDAAEAANRAKSAFLANTSHEIRTPLNGLLGLARMALHHDLDATRRQQYLLQILDSAQSLAGILSDILDLSKIEAGKITLESVNFGLRDLLTSVHHAYQSLAQARGLALVLRIGEGVPARVQGDPVRVRQILTNYVSNALKFTERGQARIEAQALPNGRIRLTVHDTGTGIDAPTQARLFAPFTQADDSTTRRYGGTGLGLSICRELATLMGGEVGLTSELGHGSTFWAELPLPASSAAPDPGTAAQDDDQALRGMRVLLVEDNPVNMMIGVAMLEQWGVEVAEASDGRAALDAVNAATAKGRAFDLVLMDVQMPGMGGHEATQRIRERHDAHALPIVALTAAALVSERNLAMAAGMNDFLTKPIDAARLRATLTRHLPVPAQT